MLFRSNQISYALSGLLPNTSYKLMVQSVCGTETSDWSVALDFVTKCNLVTVTQNEPYFENFDSYEGKGYSTIGVMPDCWSRAYYGSSASYAPHVYNSYAQSAPNSLVMYVTSSTSYSNGDGKVYLFMPEFTNGLGGLILTFYGRTYSTTYGVLALGYVMNDDSETFVELTTVPLTTTITKYKYDLRGYTIPMGARLAYRFVNTSTSTAYCAIDNVLLMLPNVETEILGMSVALPAGSQVGAAQIDEENNTVKMIVAVGTDLTSIAPAFTLSDFACEIGRAHV